MGDVQLQTSADVTEFLEYTERQTKTRMSAEPKETRTVKPNMFSVSGSDRDPLPTFHLYAAKRPEQMNSGNSAFYLAVILTKMGTSSKPWFKATPIGENKLNSVMKTMAQKAGLNAEKPHQPQRKKANDPKVKRLITSPYSHHANTWPKKCSEPQ